MKQKSLTASIKPIVIVSLLLSFGYVGFVVQPFLYAHHAQSPFIFSIAFFKSFLQFPGEPAEYIANFFMQIFYKPVSGIILFSLISGLQFILVLLLLKTISKSIFTPLLALIPLMFSMVLANNYNLPYSTEISVILILALLLQMAKSGAGIFRLMLFFISAALLIYYISGSGYFLLFSLAVALIPFNLNYKQRAVFIAFLAGFALILPYVATHFIFAIPPKQQYFYFFQPKAFFMDYKPSIVFVLYLLSMPLLIILTLILKSFETKTQKQMAIQTVIILVLIAGFAVFSHYFSFQPDEKKKVAADYYCYTNNAEKTAANAKSLKDYNFKANVNYNLVMSKTGQLNEKAFDFMQITGSDAIYPDVEFQTEMSFVAADFYYNLGFITEARHWAYETLVFYPDNRRTLQLLVKIHLVTGEYTAARQYLGLLKSSFGSKKFIREFEPVVNDSTLFHNYPELVEKRSFIPAEDELNPLIEERLKQLLAANLQNKKAYEFLMLYYLMESDAEKFVELCKNAGQYFDKIPVVYEEALMIFGEKYELTEKGQSQISNETKAHFDIFTKNREQYKNSIRMARNKLYKEFGNSYFYYREFVYPNVIKPDIIDDDSDYPAI
ncbi:MAG: DUF6057 family protein [Draconibacterium sp.]